MRNYMYKILANLARPLLKVIWGYDVEKIGLDTLQPPFVVVSSHSTRIDFVLTGCALYPHQLNFLGSSHNFTIKSTKKLVEKSGTISKEKSMGDLVAVRKIKRAVEEGNAVIVFPAGMSSHTGESYPIPVNTGKLVKFLNVPVVTAKIEGGYWAMPPFSGGINRGKIKITLKKLLDADELKLLSNDEIFNRIEKEIAFDDIEYQKMNPVKLGRKRLGNLDRILYECANCGAQYAMVPNKNKNTLMCTSCGNTIFLDKFGTLRAANEGSKTLSNIRDYCNMEMQSVLSKSENFNVELNVTRKNINLKTAEATILSPGKLIINAGGLRFVNAEEDIIYLPPTELKNVNQFNLKQLYIAQNGCEIMFEPEEKNKILSVLWYCKFGEENKTKNMCKAR